MTNRRKLHYLGDDMPPQGPTPPEPQPDYRPVLPDRPGKLWLDPPELGDHVQASPGPCARCGAKVRLRLQDGEAWFCVGCGQAHYQEKWGRAAGEETG